MGQFAVPLMIAGSALSAIGSIQQGQAQAAAYKAQAQANEYNAQVQRNNARVALDQSTAQSELQRRKFDALQGEAYAAVAQSGTGFDGSNVDLLRQNAVANELDVLTIRYEGQMKARGLMAQSELDKMQAKAANNAASDAITGSYFRAGANLLSGVGSAYSARIPQLTTQQQMPIA